MIAAQSFRIYEILGRHFNNSEDAKIVVTEIEQIIETKLDGKKDVLATKEDIGKLQIGQKEMQVDMEKCFNQLTIWIIGIFIALSGIIIAVVKL